MQGSRPERVGEQIRQALGEMLTRSVHDPGIGFITITHVKVSPDLQLARAYYTQLGDEKARKDTVKALARAMPFLRRELGSRLRLRRVPELRFQFDEGVVHQDRVEKILMDLELERRERATEAEGQTGNEAKPEHGDEDGS